MGSSALPTPTSSMMPSSKEHKVFVYGTLMANEVVEALLKRVPSSFPAILHNYHRFSIKARVYPAILPVENKTVTGKVLFGITDPELDILDTFEDDEYERRTVEVNIIDCLEKITVYTYVWQNKNDPYLHGDWSFDEWRKVHFKDYHEMTINFVKELEYSEPTTGRNPDETYSQDDQVLLLNS